MSEVNNYISNGINSVFGQSPEDLTIANSYLSKYTDQTYLLINNLNGLCGCDFIAEAKLQGIIPSQSLINVLYSIFIDAGVEVPNDILLQYQSRDVDSEIEKLGSFYSCISEDDPNPILVATGSYTSPGRNLAEIQCNRWSMKDLSRVDEASLEQKFFTETYFSVTGEAPCSQIVFIPYIPVTPIGYGYGVCIYALYNDLPNEIVEYPYF